MNPDLPKAAECLTFTEAFERGLLVPIVTTIVALGQKPADPNDDKPVSDPVGRFRFSNGAEVDYYCRRWHTLENDMIPVDRRRVEQILVMNLGVLVWINIG